MRHLNRVSLSLILVMTAGGCGEEEKRVHTDLAVMTFNVLCSFCDDEYDPWEDRLAFFDDILTRHAPDLIGLQELTWPEEVEQFLALRDGYRAIYFTGEEAGPIGLIDYPDATILYRSDRFTPAETGFYWLSPEPDVPWSSGFADGVQFPRIVAWTVFEETATGLEFFFVNTHFDNNPPSQDRSAPLLLERNAPFAERVPIVVTGDFNSQPDDPAYHTLVEHLTNSFDIAATWSIDTNQNPPPAYDVDNRIDHIFVAGHDAQWECPQWTVDMHNYGPNRKYPSDHFAIMTRLGLSAGGGTR